MSQRSLSNRLKLIIIGVGVCGIFFYSYLLPFAAMFFESENVYPSTWFVFFLVSAVPCYAVLVYAYMIARNIGADRSFSEENARFLRRISTLAAVDAAYVFVGSSVFFCIDSPELLPIALVVIIVFIGVSVSVAAVALSHLVSKAARLQDEQNLTI